MSDAPWDVLHQYHQALWTACLFCQGYKDPVKDAQAAPPDEAIIIEELSHVAKAKPGNLLNDAILCDFRASWAGFLRLWNSRLDFRFFRRSNACDPAVFLLYPARIAAWEAFKSTRYSSTSRACFSLSFIIGQTYHWIHSAQAKPVTGYRNSLFNLCYKQWSQWVRTKIPIYTSHTLLDYDKYTIEIDRGNIYNLTECYINIIFIDIFINNIYNFP